MEFVFTCRKHGTELSGSPEIIRDEKGVCQLDQSVMWCQMGVERTGEFNEEYCYEEWKVTVTF